MEQYNELKEMLTASEVDAKAFYEKGNKSAGTRLRKDMLKIKALAQVVRLSVLEAK